MDQENQLLSNQPQWLYLEDGRAKVSEDLMREYLAEETEALFARMEELLRSAGRVPPGIDNDIAAGKSADLIKLIAACI